MAGLCDVVRIAADRSRRGLHRTGAQTHSIAQMKIYIANLTAKATVEQVRELFVKYGTVEDVYFVNDKATGEPRGFGFVFMPDPAQAKAAMQALNVRELDGKTLTVNEPKAKKKVDPGPPKRGSRPGGHYGRSRGHRLRR